MSNKMLSQIRYLAERKTYNQKVRLKHQSRTNPNHDQSEHGNWAEGRGGTRDGVFPTGGGGGAGGIQGMAQQFTAASRRRKLPKQTQMNLFSLESTSTSQSANSQVDTMIQTAIDKASSEMKWFERLRKSYADKYQQLQPFYFYAKNIQGYSSAQQIDMLNRLVEIRNDGKGIIYDSDGNEINVVENLIKSIGTMGEPEARLHAVQIAIDARKKKFKEKQTSAFELIRSVMKNRTDVGYSSTSIFRTVRDAESKYLTSEEIEASQIVGRTIIQKMQSDASKYRNLIENANNELNKLIVSQNISDEERSQKRTQLQSDIASYQKELSKSSTTDYVNIGKALMDLKDVDVFDNSLDIRDDLFHLEENALDYLMFKYPDAKTDKTQRDELVHEMISYHVGSIEGVKISHFQQLFTKIGPNKEYPSEKMPTFFSKFLKTPAVNKDLIEIFNSFYDDMQERYKKESRTKYRLFRGRRPDSPPRGIPFESWSSDKTIADLFSAGELDTDDVDMKYVFADHRTLPYNVLDKGEDEFVVFGWAYWNNVWSATQAAIQIPPKKFKPRFKHQSRTNPNHDQSEHGNWAEGRGGTRDGVFPTGGGGAGGMQGLAQQITGANKLSSFFSKKAKIIASQSGNIASLFQKKIQQLMGITVPQSSAQSTAQPIRTEKPIKFGMPIPEIEPNVTSAVSSDNNVSMLEMFSNTDFPISKDIDSEIFDIADAIEKEAQDWARFAQKYASRTTVPLHKSYLYAKYFQKYSAQKQIEIADRLIELEGQISPIMIKNEWGSQDNFADKMLESIGIMGEPEARLHVVGKLIERRVDAAKNAQIDAFRKLKNTINSPLYTSVLANADAYIQAKIDEINKIDENNLPNDIANAALIAFAPIRLYLDNQLTDLSQQESDNILEQARIKRNEANLPIQEVYQKVGEVQKLLPDIQKEMSRVAYTRNQLVVISRNLSIDYNQLRDVSYGADSLSTIGNNSIDYMLLKHPNAKNDAHQRLALFAELVKWHAENTAGLKLSHMHELVAQIGPNKDYPIPRMFTFFPKFAEAPKPHPDLVDIFQSEYDAAQEYYKNNNITKITLHRGYKTSGPPRGIPFESWSTDYIIADQFSKNDGEIGVVETDEIDVKYLLTDHVQMPYGTFPFSHEFEYVVLGWAYWNNVWRGEQPSIDLPENSSEQTEEVQVSSRNRLLDLLKKLTSTKKSSLYHIKSRLKHQSRTNPNHDQSEHGNWAEGRGGTRDGVFPTGGGGGAGGIQGMAQQFTSASRRRRDTNTADMFSENVAVNNEDESINAKINDIVQHVNQQSSWWTNFNMKLHRNHDVTFARPYLYAQMIQQYSAEDQIKIAQKAWKEVNYGSSLDVNVPIMYPISTTTYEDAYYPILQSIGLFGEVEAREFVISMLFKRKKKEINIKDLDSVNEMQKVINDNQHLIDKHSKNHPDIDSFNVFKNLQISSYDDDFDTKMNSARKQAHNASNIFESALRMEVDEVNLKLSDTATQLQNLYMQSSDNWTDAQILDLQLEQNKLRIEASELRTQIYYMQKAMRELDVPMHDKVTDVGTDSSNPLNDIMNFGIDYLLEVFPDAENDDAQLEQLSGRIINGYTSLMKGFKLAHIQELFRHIGPNKDFDSSRIPNFFPKIIKPVKSNPKLARIMQKAYEKQQKLYEILNLQSMKLYRGHKPGSPPKGIPIESWSIDKSVAVRFSERYNPLTGKVDVGEVSEDDIDSKYFISDFTTRPSVFLAHELEYMIFGWAYWNDKWKKEQNPTYQQGDLDLKQKR